ncbi:hypothetical protein [Hoeflea prorocentri]|uniref:Uncharacterized protein n=1 Tax=Hoeflea prorocentri TaxID=1922333 RepID=A0A9X3ZGT7_9HYPH|nr:hypothetical protein [Hoeflea prorocentri]MCY6381117.1 hypothetical protein [Hoeflea prorocentri]MDA5398917.1 hypothetical protein [Hoeflea prorocentri]
MDPAIQGLFDNAATILGFGFLGLSMVFVVLGYLNVKQIVSQPDPNEAAVNLSRFFLKIALVFMVCAGPLQWVTLALENHMSTKEVELHITMTHPEWDEGHGDILLVHKGQTHALINNPYVGVYGEDDEIQLNAERVATVIRKIQAQLTVINEAARGPIGGGNNAPTTAPDEDRLLAPPPVADIRILSGG